MPQPSAEATFIWAELLEDGLIETYADGSRRGAGHQLMGLYPRHRRAFAAYDDEGRCTAAAYGRPPAWIDSIYATETWTLLVAALSSHPSNGFRIDWMSVLTGCLRGEAWATAPDRRHARVWGPLKAAMEGQTAHKVRWMPADCTTAAVGARQLSDGQALSQMSIGYRS